MKLSSRHIDEDAAQAELWTFRIVFEGPWCDH